MGWRGRVLGLFCALSLVAGAFAFGWDWDAALLWDGEHVAVGSKFGKAKERISLTAVRPFGYGAFSCGMDGRLMEGAFGTNRLSPRVDYHIGIEGLCYIDFGYQHNFYFRVEEGKRHSNEVHGTAHFGSDFLLESGIVYKVEERDFNVWLFTSRTGSMAPFGVNFLSLRSSICIGYDCCFHPKGLMNYYRRSTSGEHRHFFYYGWGGDLILRRDPSPAYTFVGLRFAGNSASKTNWNNQNGHHRRLCWIETGVLLPF